MEEKKYFHHGESLTPIRVRAGSRELLLKPSHPGSESICF
jgi:hypothetical protein